MATVCLLRASTGDEAIEARTHALFKDTLGRRDPFRFFDTAELYSCLRGEVLVGGNFHLVSCFYAGYERVDFVLVSLLTR